MKKIKKFLIPAFMMLACALTCVGVNSLTAKAEETKLASLTESNYKVEYASIRYTTANDDKSGIRFSIRMDKTEYETITAIDGITMGALIIPDDLVDDLTLSTASARNVLTYGLGINEQDPTQVASMWTVAQDDTTQMETVVYLYDIDEKSYNRDIAVVAYAQVGDEVFYTNQVAESVSEVAKKLLVANETSPNKLPVDKVTQLEGFLNEYTVTFYDVDGTTVLYSQSHAYGDIVDLPTVATEYFQTWYEYKGNDTYEFEEKVLDSTVTVKGNIQYKVARKTSSMLSAVADTNVALDFATVYGEEKYSNKVQFNAAGSEAVTFTFNENAPVAPADATHATIYVYTGHASYNVVLSTYNYEKNFAQLENFSWQEWKMTISEYNAFKNGQPIMLQDKDGNSVGRWLYMSAPVFTTEELDVFYGNGITKDTSVAYGNDSYSYKINGNSIIFASSLLLEAMGSKDEVTFYVKSNVNTTFNYMTYEPWDSNTVLNYLPASGEWTPITLTRAQVEALVANPFNKFLQARTWEGGAVFYISETLKVPSDSMLTAVADTQTDIDKAVVYGEQQYSHKVQFNAAGSGTVTFTFNEKAPVAPADATHATIYVYTGHASYNVVLSTYNYEKNFAQLENFSWQPWKMTVSEYNAFKNGQPITLQDKDGNSVGKWLYMSAPIFTTEELDVFYGNGVTKDTSVVYGNELHSYKVNGNSIIFASSILLDAMGDNDEITFYIKANVNTTFNYMTYEPWDSNTILNYLPASGEWTPITLTRAQVEALVANPFNKFLQARTWEGGAVFYISQVIEIPGVEVPSMLTAIADTETGTDKSVVYGDEEYSNKVQFNAAGSGTVTFTFNENAPVAPAGATHATIYVYTGHASYNVIVSTYNYEKNFAQLENFSWQPWKMTVSEYNAFKNGQPITLQDPNGNSVGRWLYMSAPVFTTEELDVFYGNGVTKDTSVAYDGELYSYKVNGNSIIFASSILLDAMGDNDEITFYIKSNVNTTFNYMTYEPWDSNTILNYLPASGEWTPIMLTRAQVEALVANPFNKFLQARTWEGGAVFYISQIVEVPSMLTAVTNTQTAVDGAIVYGEQQYSHKVQFNTASSEAVTFTFNKNAPVAPASATHATIYVYTGHASYNVIVSTYNFEKNFAQLDNFSWQPWKMTVSEYNAFKNGQPITLQDPNGNSVGRWLYMSAPVFTTEELDVFYGNGVTKDTSVAYGNDSYSYKVNGNSIIFASSRLLELLGDGDTITFYIKSNVNTTFNYMTYEPWDSNTILNYLPNSGEWTAITLTREQVEALVANPFNKFLQARTWEGGAMFYISETVVVA